MYLAMYKNGSSSSRLGAIEESSVGDDGSEAIAFDDHHLAGEEGSENSRSVEEPMDEALVWREDRLDSDLSEFGDVGWSVRLEHEEAPGLGVGWMSHRENSSGTVRPCVYSSFRCQQSVGVCP